MLLAVSTPAMPRSASALEAEAYGSVRAFYERLPDAFSASRLTREPESTPGASDRLSGQLFAVGRIWDQPLPGLVWNLGLDTGLIDLSGAGIFGDGRELDQHLAETWLLGATYLDVQPIPDGSLILRAGKLRPKIGAGAIFDAYGWGGLVDLDLRFRRRPIPLAFRAWGGLPSGRFDEELKSSPLFSLSATVEPTDGLELTFFGALFLDRDDAFAPVASRALIRQTGVAWNGPGELANVVFDRLAGLIESEVGTRGTLGWGGAELAWRHRGWRVQVTGIASFGTIETALDDDGATARLRSLRGELNRISTLQVSDPERLRERFIANAVAVSQLERTLDFGIDEVRRDTLGAFLLAELETPRFGPFEVETFFVYASGEDGTSFAEPSDRLSSFASVTPLLPLTFIFFSGSTAPSQQTPSFSTIAPEGSGVLGGGVGPRVTFGAVEIGSMVAALWSDVPPPDRDSARFYGLEVDLGLTWVLTRHLHLFAEGAWLGTGSYFGDAPGAAQLFGGIGGTFSTIDARWGR